jgi:hypothetical protein
MSPVLSIVKVSGSALFILAEVAKTLDTEGSLTETSTIAPAPATVPTIKRFPWPSVAMELFCPATKPPAIDVSEKNNVTFALAEAVKEVAASTTAVAIPRPANFNRRFLTT